MTFREQLMSWMIFLVGFGVLLFCTFAFGAPLTTPGFRPTEADLSCAYAQKEVLAWYQGDTTTQAQRMSMESSMTLFTVDAFRFARTVPSVWRAIPERFDRFSKVMAIFIAERENEALFGLAASPKSKGQPPGQWFIFPEGRHYGGEPTILQSIRHGLLVNQGPAECAASPLLTPQMLALFALKVVNGKCVEDTAFPKTPHTGKPNPVRNKLGLVVVHPRPPLTADQLAKLEATDAAHHASAESKCGGPPTALSVGQSHKDFEATAGDEEQLTLFQMKRFSGYEDSIANGNPQGWTPADVCKLARLTHEFHHQWSEALKAGDWARTREADNAHATAHILLNLKDARYRVKLPRDGCRGLAIEKCLVETGPQIVARLP